MKLFTQLIISAVLLLQVLYAQPLLQWSSEYNGSTGGREGAQDMLVDGLGNVYVTGQSDSAGSTGHNIVTVKYAVDGTMTWVRTYSFSAFGDKGMFLETDPFGYIYVIGTVSVTYTNVDIIVIKYKPNGSMVWAKRFAPPGYLANGLDIPNAAMADNNSLYITGIITEDAPSNNRQMVIFKSDFNAGYVSAVYGNLGEGDHGEDITTDPLGNIYVTGITEETSAVSKKGFVNKYSSTLTMLWNRVIMDTARTYTSFENIKLNSAGDIIVTGTAKYPTSSNDVYITSKLSPSAGTISWYARCLPSGPVWGGARANSLSIGPSDVINIGGSFYEYGPGIEKGICIQYKSTGELLWTKRYDSLSNVNAIVNDPSGNIFAVGIGLNKKLFAKISSSGDIIWYGSTPNSKMGMVTRFVSPEILYIAGYSYTGSGNTDFFANKYKVPSSRPPAVISSSEFRLDNNYPNPFNPVTSIKYSIPYYSTAVLKVYDNIGREVAVLVNEAMQAGEYEISFDASKLASGVYFYKLESGSYSEIRKMVLVK